jgi:F-type H+-transporting ATPase subunit alpha
MSLLIGRAPGREAYSGDIFYLHSRLLERSSKISKKFGLGSLTALPIVETQEENISAYIPTNVISITDGQIYLSKSLFKNSILPAIDINKSISRIGSKAQTVFLSDISSTIKEILRNYFEISILLQTGQILNKRQKYQYTLGKSAIGIWLQSEFQNVSYAEQYILCVLLNNNKLCSKKTTSHIASIKFNLYKKNNF